MIILIELTFLVIGLMNITLALNERQKRIQKIILITIQKRLVFFKDFYGFRIKDENINEQYDPSIVKVVFNGEHL